MMREREPYPIFHLCLENAEQRKLDVALYYAKQLLKLETGSSVKGYIILARILSAQKLFVDYSPRINVALEQTVKWDQRELLSGEAKPQIAGGILIFLLRSKSGLKALVLERSFQRKNQDRSLEMETWHDLAVEECIGGGEEDLVGCFSDVLAVEAIELAERPGEICLCGGRHRAHAGE